MKYRFLESSFTVETFDNGFAAVFPMATLSEGVKGFDCLTIRKVYKTEDHEALMDDIDDFLSAEIVEHYLESH